MRIPIISHVIYLNRNAIQDDTSLPIAYYPVMGGTQLQEPTIQRQQICLIAGTGDLDTSLFPSHTVPIPAQPPVALPPSPETESRHPLGIFPILERFQENRIADIKFASKTIARCCALGAAVSAYSAYSGIPHLALACALMNITLSFVSDLCEKEIRERHERKMEQKIAELTHLEASQSTTTQQASLEAEMREASS